MDMQSETGPDDCSLLMVEDNAMMSDAVAIALRRRGYEVLQCRSLAEARSHIEQKAPHYALVDLRLPDGSGLGLVQELRRANPKVSIVVLTGFANIATAIEAIKLGARNYLCKPADIETIDAALQGRELPADAMGNEPAPATIPDVETEHIQRVLAEHSSNISATARALGMHRRTLQRKLSRSVETP
jgi:two-component system response regulator RegA